MVDGFLTRPPTRRRARSCPTILRIHGGPVVAVLDRVRASSGRSSPAHGYAVVAANPRGSSGYGRDFSRAIWADWGEQGLRGRHGGGGPRGRAGRRRSRPPRRRRLELRRHPHRLRHHARRRASRPRSRAPASPTSSPATAPTTTSTSTRRSWACPGRTPRRLAEALDARSSKSDKIKTPTLFLCGEVDMNVPLLNSEQMYQAVRRLGTSRPSSWSTRARTTASASRAT